MPCKRQPGVLLSNATRPPLPACHCCTRQPINHNYPHQQVDDSLTSYPGIYRKLRMMPGLARRDPKHRYQTLETGCRSLAESARHASARRRWRRADDDGHDEESVDDRHQRRCERVDNGPDHLEDGPRRVVISAESVPIWETETTRKSKHDQPLPQNSQKRCAYMLSSSSSVKTLVKEEVRRCQHLGTWRGRAIELMS